MNNLLDFEYSPWFLILCLALGVGYSFIQYKRETPWTKKINRFLAIGRAFFVAFLAMLILGPTIWTMKNTFEKPLLVMAIDNSESIALTSDSVDLQQLVSDLNTVKSELINKGWNVALVDLDGEAKNIDSINFNRPKTNLTGMVRFVESEFDGANLAGILLVSDGIFNTGFSPDFISTFTPIYALGLGDTIPRKDLSIIDVRHNKTVYQDNRFPVEVSIRNEGLGPITTQLSIYQNGGLVDQVAINVTPENRLIQHGFTIEAKHPGKQRISVVVGTVQGEFTSVNNKSSFYIDVVEGQQKVLIIADAPSPDIKVVRLALEKKENFLVDVNIGDEITSLDYDLIILNQLPNRLFSSGRYQQIVDLDIPKLFIVGSATDTRLLSRSGIVNLKQSGNQTDQVTASINPDFNSFALANDIDELLSAVPPLAVPYGQIAVQPTDEVLLYQQVGNITTNNPLIYFTSEEQKQGVIIGTGLWKWRLNEYQNYNETLRFDEMITKIVMYLAAKPDNRQFKMYPVKESYEVGENMQFIAETYNELFEPVYGEPVSLTITRDNFNKDYSFTPLEGSRELSIDNLSEGIYRYQSRTSLNGETHRVNGQFSVENPDLEAADLTADFTVMHKLAKESEGAFYTLDKIKEMKSDFGSLEAPAIIHTQQKERLFLNLPWILVCLVLLITGEWLTRKMMGGY